MLGTVFLVYFYSSSLKAETLLTGKLFFRPLLHQPRIYAGAPAGVHVTTVHAYDPDNPRKKVEYNLPNVFDFQYFIIDKNSGNLTTSQPITKTIGDTYEVMVAAASQGSSELEHLQIAVTEFNLFAPHFEKRSYFIDMHSKTAVNSTILYVKATDNDPAPINAEIYYKMDQNVTSKYFSLNYMTGELILIQQIIETSKSNLSFGIFAEDGGSPKRWDYVPVYINIKNISVECPEEEIGITGDYQWNATKYGKTVFIKCPFGNKEGFVKRKCSFTNGTIAWSDIDTTECKTKEFILVKEIVNELHNITKNPLSLDVEALETTFEGLVTIANHAIKDRELAQNMVDIISSVLEVNDSVLKETDSCTFDNVLESIEKFASRVELQPGQHFQLVANNIRIELMEWHSDFENEMEDYHIQITAPAAKEEFKDKKENTKDSATIQVETFLNISKANNNTEITKQLDYTKYAKSRPIHNAEPPKGTKLPVFQVLIPKEAFQEAHRKLDKNVRVKFIVYYNKKLFRTRRETADSSYMFDTEKEPKSEKNSKINEPLMSSPVLQISVGNLDLKNLRKPLVYIFPLETERKASCVFWDDIEKVWSTRGLDTNQTIEKIICKSTHMTAFSVLLDMTPNDKPDKKHDSILSIMSYAGSSLSVLGLIATIVTYSSFRCLNRDHPGKILMNLCFSLLMMNTVFLVGSSDLIDDRKVCAGVAILIHYFVLTSLFWMCAEAINMYQLLVYVFASSETHFMVKRFFFAWVCTFIARKGTSIDLECVPINFKGEKEVTARDSVALKGIPFIFVSVTAVISFEAYGGNADSCVLSAQDPWVYYCSFMAPSCLILLANVFIFLRVSKVIFTPKLTTRISRNTDSNIVTAAQVRGAFTVMVLLGTTWVFGTLAVGKIKTIFQYIFCISNSLQGFLIFLVRCLLYPEARSAWIYLLRTGKFKTHRGILPPGTVSSNSHSVTKSGVSSNVTLRTESFDGSSSDETKNLSRVQVNEFVRNLPNSTSLCGKRKDKHSDIHRFVYRTHTESNTDLNKRDVSHCSHNANSRKSSRFNLTEMNRNCNKGKSNESNTLWMRLDQEYHQKKCFNISSFSESYDGFVNTNSPSISKMEIMKLKTNVEPIIRRENDLKTDNF